MGDGGGGGGYLIPFTFSGLLGVVPEGLAFGIGIGIGYPGFHAIQSRAVL